MKRELSSFDLHHIMNELSFLVDAKVNQVYQPDENSIAIEFHKSGKGTFFLRINPKFIFLSSKKQKNPETPFNFCIALRKYLKNSRLISIKQIGFERIVSIEFSSKIGKFYIFAEFFDGGNIILTDESKKIILALNNKKMKERTVRGGIKYETPLEKPDFFKIKKSEFLDVLNSSKEPSLVLTLAKIFGLGGTYAEELCLLSKIDKNAKKLSENEKTELFKAIETLRKIETNCTSYRKSGKIKDIFPIKLETYSDFESENFSSFNEALDSLLPDEIEIKLTSEKQKKANEKTKKLENIIKKQKKQLELLEKSAEENRKKGELIYNNYQFLSQILEEIKKARNNHSWAEIKEKLKNHKIIKDINEKEGKIFLELKG